ncbi:MAG: VOC family protein [Ruminococcaceae bacterium]|nr:VOC family protein [Oscillospiraceae bacterium]
MITGIEHIAIYAKDTKKLSDWYVNMFDGKIVYDNGKGTYFVAFSDKSMIEFCANTQEDNVLTGLEVPGIRHIALSVDDFDAAVAKVKGANVEILKDATVTDKGIGTMFFRDPEGNILHFISRVEPLV